MCIRDRRSCIREVKALGHLSRPNERINIPWAGFILIQLQCLLVPGQSFVLVVSHIPEPLEVYHELPEVIGPVRGIQPCLLYTSDAADDLTRVDLGGGRVIKKKI